jgi:TonB family protein
MAPGENVVAQDGTSATPPEAGVVLTKLYPPAYPPLARQARIVGDVRIRVRIRPDGSVASVEVISGHPILKGAVLDSAGKSTFECRGCSEPETLFSMTYGFTLPDVAERNPDPCCCTQKPDSSAGPVANAPEPQVTQSQNHVIVSVRAGPVCVCPDECEMKWARDHSRFRSARCLYLWKCGVRHISIQ